jgi:hypothetical protein
MSRPKIRTTILSVVTALVIAAVAAPLASAAVPIGPTGPTDLSTQGAPQQDFGPNPYPAGYFSSVIQVNRDSDGQLKMWVGAVVIMERGAWGKGYHFEYRIWGDDPHRDDLLKGPLYAQPQLQGPYSDADGLYFNAKVEVGLNRLLNEDADNPLDDRDEIYVGIRLVNSSGKTVRSTETERIYGYW